MPRPPRPPKTQREEKYITFPLHALAYGRNPLERLTTILQWSIIDLGPSAVRGAASKKPERLAALDRELVTSAPSTDATGDRAFYQIAIEMLLPPALADHPDFTQGKCENEHARLEQFITEQEQRCRSAPGRKRNLVMHLQLGWILNCFNQLNGHPPEKPMPYDRFAILCAIYSKIGRKKHDQPNGTGGRGVCGWKEIQRRALGYLTPQDMERCMPFRADAAAPMSRDVIRNRIDHLWDEGFFALYVPRKGRKHLPTWYGRNGITDEQLATIAEAARGDTSRTFKYRVKQKRQRTDELVRQHAPPVLAS